MLVAEGGAAAGRCDGRGEPDPTTGGRADAHPIQVVSRLPRVCHTVRSPGQAPEGGESMMSHPQVSPDVVPDETTLRAWEEMRDQVWQELQEGGQVADSTIDALGDLVARYNFRGSTKRRRPLRPGNR